MFAERTEGTAISFRLDFTVERDPNATLDGYKFVDSEGDIFDRIDTAPGLGQSVIIAPIYGGSAEMSQVVEPNLDFASVDFNEFELELEEWDDYVCIDVNARDNAEPGNYTLTYEDEENDIYIEIPVVIHEPVTSGYTFVNADTNEEITAINAVLGQTIRIKLKNTSTGKYLDWFGYRRSFNRNNADYAWNGNTLEITFKTTGNYDLTATDCREGFIRFKLNINVTKDPNAVFEGYAFVDSKGNIIDRLDLAPSVSKPVIIAPIYSGVADLSEAIIPNSEYASVAGANFWIGEGRWSNYQSLRVEPNENVSYGTYTLAYKDDSKNIDISLPVVVHEPVTEGYHFENFDNGQEITEINTVVGETIRIVLVDEAHNAIVDFDWNGYFGDNTDSVWDDSILSLTFKKPGQYSVTAIETNGEFIKFKLNINVARDPNAVFEGYEFVDYKGNILDRLTTAYGTGCEFIIAPIYGGIAEMSETVKMDVNCVSFDVEDSDFHLFDRNGHDCIFYEAAKDIDAGTYTLSYKDDSKGIDISIPVDVVKPLTEGYVFVDANTGEELTEVHARLGQELRIALKNKASGEYVNFGCRSNMGGSADWWEDGNIMCINFFETGDYHIQTQIVEGNFTYFELFFHVSEEADVHYVPALLDGREMHYMFLTPGGNRDFLRICYPQNIRKGDIPMNKVKYETPKMEVVYFENGAIDTSETSYKPGENELPFDPASIN